jgi:hypothetical protein
MAMRREQAPAGSSLDARIPGTESKQSFSWTERQSSSGARMPPDSSRSLAIVDFPEPAALR